MKSTGKSQSDSLTTMDQKKTLSGKKKQINSKKKKKTVKPVLMPILSSYFQQLGDDDTFLYNIFERELIQSTENDVDKTTFKNTRAALTIGVNATYRHLDHDKVAGVVVAADVQPSDLVEHILARCERCQVPVAKLENLRSLTKDKLKFSCICLGFLKSSGVFKGSVDALLGNRVKAVRNLEEKFLQVGFSVSEDNNAPQKEEILVVNPGPSKMICDVSDMTPFEDSIVEEEIFKKGPDMARSGSTEKSETAEVPPKKISETLVENPSVSPLKLKLDENENNAKKTSEVPLRKFEYLKRKSTKERIFIPSVLTTSQLNTTDKDGCFYLAKSGTNSPRIVHEASYIALTNQGLNLNKDAAPGISDNLRKKRKFGQVDQGGSVVQKAKKLKKVRVKKNSFIANMKFGVTKKVTSNPNRKGNKFKGKVR